MSLEPTTPHAAVEEYLNNLIGITQSTKNNHESRLNNFLEWCDQEGITNINEVNEQTLLTYRSWRSDQVSPITLRICFGTVRKFIGYCETTNRVHQGTAENVDLPNVADGEDVDDTVLAVEEAQQILDYLRKYEYATRDHLIFELLWHTGIRLSALYGFDKDDYSRTDIWMTASIQAPSCRLRTPTSRLRSPLISLNFRNFVSRRRYTHQPLWIGLT